MLSEKLTERSPYHGCLDTGRNLLSLALEAAEARDISLETSLLIYLLFWGVQDCEDFLTIVENYALAKEDLASALERPERYNAEEIQCIKDNITYWKQEFESIISKWAASTGFDREKLTDEALRREIGTCREWFDNYKKFLESENGKVKEREEDGATNY